MPARRLVIFDVDGTLVDSQSEILAAMATAFATENLPLPPRAAILSIVGLSLPQAFARLCPDAAPDLTRRLVTAYKAGFNAHHHPDISPLYPGAREVLTQLHADPATTLAVATGKSRRGLDRIIDRHGLHGIFASLQTADHHPSKPDPAMIHAILAETGIAAAQAVMIGDTSYDIDMGRAAGVRTVAVTWGYHPAAALNADATIDHFAALPAVLTRLPGPFT